MSEGPARRSLTDRAFTWYVTSKPVAVVWGFIFAAFGIASAWTALTGTDSRDGLVAMAGLFLVCAWASVLRGVAEHPERRVHEGELDGAPALVFFLSLKGPIAMALFSGALVAIFVALWGVSLADGGWLFVLAELVFGIWAAQGLFGVVRRPRIFVTADEIMYRGIEWEARVPWDSVFAIGYGADDKARRYFVRISCSSASDLVRKRVVYIPEKLSTDVVRAEPSIDLNDGLLRLPEFYVQVLSWFVGVPREERARLVASLADEPGDHRAE